MALLRWIQAAQLSCSGGPKRRGLESCGGKNVHVHLGPFHLNWPEPVLFGRPERTDGRRPKATFTRYWPIFQPVTNSPHIPQAKNIPYQPLLIKPIFSVLAYAEKQLFSKLVFQYQFVTWVLRLHGTTLTIQRCRSFGIQIFRPPNSSVNL